MKYTVNSYPDGKFYILKGENIERVTAENVARSLIQDGAGDAGFSNVVDFGVSNMGRYGIQGSGRLFLFIPVGADPNRVRGLTTKNLKDLGVLQ